MEESVNQSSSQARISCFNKNKKPEDDEWSWFCCHGNAERRTLTWLPSNLLAGSEAAELIWDPLRTQSGSF